MRIVPINIISSYVPTLSERDLDFLIEIFHNYHTGYLRLPMWGVISNCLYSSGNVNPFSSCVSGSALVMIFANTSSCIFQFQNLKLLSVSRRHSVKQHNWFWLTLLNIRKLSGGVLLRSTVLLTFQFSHFLHCLSSHLHHLLARSHFLLLSQRVGFVLILLLLLIQGTSWNSCPITTSLPLLEWFKHFLNKLKSLSNGYYYNSHSNTYLKIDFHNMLLLFQIV